MSKLMSSKISIKKSQLMIILGVVIIIALGVLVYYNWDNLKWDKTLAKVNGESIKESEVERVKQAFKQQTGIEANSSQAIDQLVSRKLLLQEVERRGISTSEEEVEQILLVRLEEMGSNLEEFKVEVEVSGDYNELISAYKEQFNLEKLVEEITLEENITVSEEEIKEFYELYEESLASGGNDTSYNEIKDQIKEVLLQQKQSESIYNLIEDLKSSSEIVYY